MIPTAHPHQELQLHHQHHAERVQRAELARVVSPSRPIRRPRRALAALALPLVLGIGIAAAGSASSAESPGAVPTGCDQASGYEAGCRLLPGHPDGWFDPGLGGAETDTRVPTGLAARIR